MITFNRSDIYTASSRAAANKIDTDAQMLAPQQSPKGSVDTVTISAAARDLAQGNVQQLSLNTYDHLASANRIVATKIDVPGIDPPPEPVYPTSMKSIEQAPVNMDDFMNEAMQGILDSRMGIDRDKLEEIEAMMEEVANDDSLSPEQKEKKLEELQKLYDKVIEEAVEKLEHQPVDGKEQEKNLG